MEAASGGKRSRSPRGRKRPDPARGSKNSPEENYASSAETASTPIENRQGSVKSVQLQQPLQARSVASGNTPPPVKNRFCLKIQKVYLEHILAGRKTVEGRLNVGQVTQIRVGDTIALECAGPKRVMVHVDKVKHFSGFREMLEAYTVKKCLPDCSSVDEGVEVYHGFPNYAQKVLSFGVLAIEISTLQCPAPSPPPPLVPSPSLPSRCPPSSPSPP